MADAKVAQSFAATFVDELARGGLQAVCAAPGSRSTPLVLAFHRHPAIRVWMHIDERSAAFFALGMAKASERPVAVLCTSGTAAAELHPAVVEAHHSRTPLLVLTADRPPELRDVGANQAIDQARLYGGAVRWFFDPGLPDDEPGAPRRWRRLAGRALAECGGPPAGPVHLNLPFREPLSPEPSDPPQPVLPDRALWAPRPRARPTEVMVERLAAQLRAAERPLVVAGEMRDGARLRHPLADVLARVDAPLLAEPSSQLRRRSALGVVDAYDAMLRDGPWAESHRPDFVLRLGAPPTSKALNQHLSRSDPTTVVVDPEGGWRDPEQLAAEFLRCDEAPLLEAVADRLDGRSGGWTRNWRDCGAVARAALDRRLHRTPLHEGQVVRALANELPENATVFVGSSMAIRDVDTFWPPAAPGQRFLGNRGASGIDGVVSAGLGAAAAAGRGAGPVALLLGDLSLYHDMNGLLAARRHGLKAVLVVLDNDGGGIFSYLPQADHRDEFEELFGTPLRLRMEDVARLYDLYFCEVTDQSQLPDALRRAFAADRTTMVCARFTRLVSVHGHRDCWAAVSEALRFGL